MISTCARTGARYQTGHYVPHVGFQTRNLFTQYNASPAGTRLYKAPQAPTEPDKPIPRPSQMYSYQMANVQNLGNQTTLSAIVDYLASIEVTLRAVRNTGDYLIFDLESALSAEQMYLIEAQAL